MTDRPVNQFKEAKLPDLKKIDTRYGEVAYLDVGHGPAVVMLHAALHDHRDFAPVLDRLAADHRVLGVDWPAHGQSPPPRAPYVIGAPLFADVLVDFVEALDLPPAVFLGNSVGGFAAARLAITHPDRVAGLVLVNSGGFAPPNPLTRWYCRMLGVPAIARQVLPLSVRSYMKVRSVNDQEIADRTRARARTNEGAAVGAALWRSFGRADFDLRGRAGGISAPTLIVWGAKDTTLPLRVVGRATHRALPQADMEVLPAGHVPFSSLPDAFLEKVEPFIATAAHRSPVDGTPSQEPHTETRRPAAGLSR